MDIREAKAGAHPYVMKTVRSYEQTFERLRERLFMVMHMAMPARAREFSNIRLQNTINGGIRNILGHGGIVC